MNSQVTTTSQEVQSVGLTELELLEAAFNEDLRCESDHQVEGNETCSIEVTNIVKYCEGELFACSNHAAWMLSTLGGICNRCNSSWGSCWKIIPI